MLYTAGLGSNFFSHIFIDEAAQLMEAEALIPLSLGSRNSVVVLVGDDKQVRLFSLIFVAYTADLSILPSWVLKFNPSLFAIWV